MAGMSEPRRVASPRDDLSLRAGVGVWVGLGIAAVLVFLVAELMAVQPDLPGRSGADHLTGVLSLVGAVIGRLAGASTLGLLTGAVAFSRFSGGELPERGSALIRWARASAQVWWIASLFMTFANPTFYAGVPVRDALRPDAWWVFIEATPSALAWLVSAVVAVVIAWTVGRSQRISGLVVAWLAGALATLFVAVTGNVSVGQDHDWATDSMGISTIALTVLISGAVGVVSSAVAGSTPPGSAAVRRYQRVAGPALVVIAAGWAVVGWQQLAGRPATDVAYGVAVIGQFAVWILLAVSWLVRQLTWRRAGAASVVRDIVVMMAGIVMLAAAEHLPPPRFLVPQSIQVNYLGYEVNTPPTIARLLSPGRPNLLWVVLCVTALGLYAWGVVRVHRAGGKWALSRILFWAFGWLLMLFLAVSGLWEYSTAAFSWHMLMHMTVNMMVPILCVLGAPFGLLIAASADAEPGRLAGPRELLAALETNRVVRVLLSPPTLWLAYVASLFIIYFSPLFPWLMRYHWGHQGMLLLFMITGYAFFNLLIGPDQGARQVPYLVRFALLVSIMPFHAIFAVGIMSATSLLGGQFYKALSTPWVTNLMADQNTAGQITWFTSEIPAFVAVIMLAVQWFGSDRSEAATTDQIIGSGTDEDELATYNEMFAELAERDRRNGEGGA